MFVNDQLTLFKWDKDFDFPFQNIKIIHQNIRLCTDDGVTATQLLWNPVLPNSLAICLSNKSLLVLSFKDQGYDFYSIDKAEQVG